MPWATYGCARDVYCLCAHARKGSAFLTCLKFNTMGDTSDLATLPCLDSITLLKELRARYTRDKIYVSSQVAVPRPSQTLTSPIHAVRDASTDQRRWYFGVPEPIQATPYIRKWGLCLTLSHRHEQLFYYYYRIISMNYTCMIFIYDFSKETRIAAAATATIHHTCLRLQVDVTIKWWPVAKTNVAW